MSMLNLSSSLGPVPQKAICTNPGLKVNLLSDSISQRLTQTVNHILDNLVNDPCLNSIS